VERSYEKLKQWRGLATRYDKLAVIFRGGAVLRAITLWVKDLVASTTTVVVGALPEVISRSVPPDSLTKSTRELGASCSGAREGMLHGSTMLVDSEPSGRTRSKPQAS